MKTGKTFPCLILILFYLLFPGNGLAFANHLFQDIGLPVIDSYICTETENNTTDNPVTGNGDECDIIEHGCNCSPHIPSEAQASQYSKYFTQLLSNEAPQLYPNIYIPIFVPPQNLV
jgi:hypothetical protein